MSETDLDIYVVEDPNHWQNPLPHNADKDDLRGQLYNLYSYLHRRGDKPIYVKNLKDFVLQVLVQVVLKQQVVITSGATGGGKIRTLVIAAHGAPGGFYLGSTYILGTESDLRELGRLAPHFARDANVYILACRCGQSEDLLRNVSKAFGGVKVHGYTDFIVTTDYGLIVTLNDGTENGGKHLVCLRNGCTETKDPVPHREGTLVENAKAFWRLHQR